jgi:ABC-type branched-subunit amino acid transport system permease subunit
MPFGGIGTLVHPILGAGFFILSREALSRFPTEYDLIPLGGVVIANVVFLPQGFSASCASG